VSAAVSVAVSAREIRPTLAVSKAARLGLGLDAGLSESRPVI